jgi:hypothetical protein
MASRGDDLFDVAVELIRETDAAWLVTDGEDAKETLFGMVTRQDGVWVPKSQCELEDNGDGTWTLTAPEWLLEKKGLL